MYCHCTCVQHMNFSVLPSLVFLNIGIAQAKCQCPQNSVFSAWRMDTTPTGIFLTCEITMLSDKFLQEFRLCNLLFHLDILKNTEPALYVRTFCFSVNNPGYPCTGSICALLIGKHYCRCSMFKFWVLMDQQYGIYAFGLDVTLWENQWLCSQRNFGCFLWTFDKHLIGKNICMIIMLPCFTLFSV